MALGSAGGGLDVLVRFIGDTSKLQDDVAKVEGTGGKLKGWAKGVGTAVASGFAIAKVAEFGKASVDAALDAQKSSAALQAVFKSMGDETGKAAAAAEKYAGSLSKKIGVDDDAIMSAQTLLATFGNVSNEAGRQSGLFNRATAAAADLAAAGYGNLDGNAKQLGKALQDPIKGVAALAKAGVTFTQQQKDQIAAMVESGDLLGAQNIVMQEVEHQVKGTAEATATSTDKMNVAWGETQESIGTALLPILEKLMPILTTVADFIARNTAIILPLVAVIGVLVVAWNIASIAATLFGVSMAAALWPVLLVIAAIIALIAIGVLIVKNWDTIKDAAAAVWDFMQKAWDAILNVIKGAFNWIKDNWPTLLAILTGPIGIAVLLISKNWDTITEAVQSAFNFIKRVWAGILAVLTAPFDAAWGIISGIIDRLSGIVTGIIDKARDVGSRVAGLIKAPINAIIRAWNSLGFKIPEVSVFGKTIGGGEINPPRIPELAKGGVVTNTGLAVVHRGEAFSGVGNGFGNTFNINVNVERGTDPAQTGRAIVDLIRAYERANGRTVLAGTGG
jgi:hypothetical protein